MNVTAADVISFLGIRNPFSMLSHLSGALLAVVGLFVLQHRAACNSVCLRNRLGLGAFGASLIFAFVASALFHYFPWRPEELTFFKKLDHAAIFLVVAGTCTVLLNAGRTPYRKELIAATWLIAVAALLVKMIVWPMALWMSAATYLTVGWIGATSVLAALRHVEWDQLRLLVYGMAVHTLGAVIFALEAPVLWPGVIEGHELFHVMVLIGTGLHFAFVLRYCTVPDTLREAAPGRKRDIEQTGRASEALA